MGAQQMIKAKRKQYMIENYDRQKICDIAKALNVSTATIYLLAKEMGLGKQRIDTYKSEPIENKKITSMTTATICGDIVRHRMGDEPIENVFNREETAKNLKMTMDDVVRVYNESLANGRYAEVEYFINNVGTRIIEKRMQVGQRFEKVTIHNHFQKKGAESNA